jgi:urease accessory protein
MTLAHMSFDSLAFLRLLQLADSALPIGATAHSFGLETLTSEDEVGVEQLVPFCKDYLVEAGELECAFCILGYRSALASLSEDSAAGLQQWLKHNMRLSAYKPARESRVASATLGRRFLQLVAALEQQALLYNALATAKSQQIETHYSTAFGLVGGLLNVGEQATALAYLQQTLGALISASQRLLPLGQSQASAIQWQLKPLMREIVLQSQQAANDPEQLATFTPLLDAGSMRHPTLITRLFIS